MKVRIIMQTSSNGSYEAVCFTEDFDSDLDYFKNPQSDVIKETITDINLPSGFPMEYQLIRE